MEDIDEDDFALDVESFEQEIAALESTELWSKASAANDIRFVRSLREDGFEPEEITRVFLALIRRFARLDLRPPEGGLYDLVQMSDLDPVVRRYRA